MAMGNTTTSELTTPQPLTQRRVSVPSDADLAEVARTLNANGIPVVSLADACAACEAPCDLGTFPSKFDVDLESQMNGTTKPYFRQVNVIPGLDFISSCIYEVHEQTSI